MGGLSTLGLESEEISLFIFQAHVFFRNEIREPQQGLVLSPPAVSRRCSWSSSHKDHRSRFLPPLGPVAKCRLEDVRIPSPAFVPCFYGHLAMCVWSAPGIVCAQNFEEFSSIPNFESFFDAQLLKSLTTLHPEISLLSIFTVEVPFASWEPLHLGWGFLRPLEKTSEYLKCVDWKHHRFLNGKQPRKLRSSWILVRIIT